MLFSLILQSESTARQVIERYYRIQRRDVSYIKFILEGYEGLALVTTVDRYDSIIKVLIAPDFVDEAAGIITALKDEIDFEEIAGEG